jgi:hypothetical protein
MASRAAPVRFGHGQITEDCYITSGATIVLVLTAMFALALVFAPRRRAVSLPG